VAVPASRLAEVLLARRRIAPYIRRTPLERSAALSAAAGAEVWLKLECWQPTRSFKVRGAHNAVLALDGTARARGLVTASAGNHGQAVALAAAAVGASATIFVPAAAPDAKKSRIRRLGAALNEESAEYDAAEAAAQAFAAASGMTFVHAYSDPAVVAGQGTVALEILEDLPEVRTLLVPVGGGGLIGGVGIVARAMAPAARVVGVQSEATPVMHDSLAAGHVVERPILPTLADGLAGAIDEPAFRLAQDVVDEMVLVPETAIPAAMRWLQQEEGVLAEGSGAVGIALLLEAARSFPGPVAAIVTGGNVDGTKLGRILAGVEPGAGRAPGPEPGA
jgi:threonine dehydratase